MLPSNYKPSSVVTGAVNIYMIKRRIADYVQATADDLGWSVEHLNTMRKRVKDAISQRHVIIARHRKALLADRRIEEMKLRHMQEMSALRAEIADAVAEFDKNPDVALHQSIDGFFPGLIEGFAEMDRRESDMWREYREQ